MLCRLFIAIFVLLTCTTPSWAASAGEQNKPNKIVSVVHCDYPPVSLWYRNAKKPVGFIVDLTDRIAARAGLEVSYICKSSWPEMMTAIENGEADLGALLKSEEREKRLLFSAPVDMTYLSFFARSQSDIDVQTVPQGYSVGVIKGSMSHEQLKKRPGIVLYMENSYQDGIFSLLAGEIGLFAGEESMILKRARETRLADRIKKVGRPFVERERGLAVKKDNLQLLELLNRSLQGFIGSPEYESIYLTWFGAPEPYWTNKRIFAAGGVFLFIIVCGMALWRYLSISRINKELLSNIAVRRKAEESLQKNEQFLNDILDNVGAFIFIKDTHYRYTYVNRKVCELFGHTAEEIVGRGDEAFFSGESVEEIMRSDRRVIELGETVTREETDLSSADKLPRSYWVVKLPLRDRSGAIHGLCGISTDITVRKQTEEALARSEEMMRNVLNSVDEGFIVIDRDYRILTSNQAFCRQVNLSDVIGKHCYEVTHRLQQPCFESGDECAVRKAFETGNPAVSYHKHTDAEGNMLYVETKAFPLKDKTGAVSSVIESISNITEKHLLEEERLKTQKLEAIGTLAGGIAHDFNNLLQGVFGYLSLAKLTIDNKKKCLTSLEEAEKALHMSVRLTNQLLTFSKGGKPIKKLLSPIGAIENAAKFALSGSRSGYRIVADEDPWLTDADEGQLEQVIQNIVLNADQAMPDGGQIEITVKNVKVPDKDLPQLLQQGQYLQIIIRDSGIGIPEHYLSRIFDPYFTTKEKGNGLGLATSYSIIRNHNGFIYVTSEPGRGTTFCIYLPAATAGERAASEMHTAAATPVRTARVLLMDDEQLIRDVAGELLKALGHEVQYAVNGEVAIAQYQSAKQSGKPFDIVILDLTIRGGMGGAETIRKLLEIDPGVKAVVSSGYADDALLANYGKQGFVASLRKPYSIEGLSDCLHAVLKEAH